MSTATRTGIPLKLGADIVRQLLPHRPPFLFVDTVEAFSSGERPSLSAAHHISPNEPVFAGHFPDLYLWPGVYTIEGLAQSCLLLSVLLEVEGAFAVSFPDIRAPGGPATVLRGWQQTPSRPGAAPERRGGLLVAADVKLVHPVFAGQRLDYHVQRMHVVDQMHRFDVQAIVAGRPVARGTLTVAMAGGQPWTG